MSTIFKFFLIKKNPKNQKKTTEKPTYVSEHCACFWTKNPTWPLSEEKGERSVLKI